MVAAGLGAAWLAPVRRIWAGRAIDALGIIFPLLGTAFIVWVFRNTYYVITADALIVHAGPIRRTVPLRLVQRLRATHNPLSSPALSFAEALSEWMASQGQRERKPLETASRQPGTNPLAPQAP